MSNSKTLGLAGWIAYNKKPEIDQQRTENPWEGTFKRADLYVGIADCGGISLFRRKFNVNGPVSAKIDATSLGVYELWCNGKRVGRVDETGEVVYDELKPGWSEYRKRVLYYTYDLTPYLLDGENTILAAVAPGWYDGRISFGGLGKTHTAFLAALNIVDADGERNIYTDKEWQGAWGSAVRASDIWDGELYDANYPSPADACENCDGIAWDEVECEEHDIFVSPHVGPTIMERKWLCRKPVSITIYNGVDDNGSDYGKIHVVRTHEGTSSFSLKKGESAVIDLGQNMVGRSSFEVSGKRGTIILTRCGEMLNDSGLASRGNDNPEGSIYSINYRSAKAKSLYVIGDGEVESYTPYFTFFGFRYLEITATDDVEFHSLRGVVIGSATRETGKMETSNPLVNKLISNIIWGQRGNYLSVPTDCPQRDERLGWTGDTQAFCGTASYNADVSGFFHKWLQDARDSQHESGMYPDVIPAVPVVGYGGAAWSDAGIIVPYTMWKMYNDEDIIRECFDSMEKYMEWLAGTNCQGPNPTYGDWLAYEPTDNRYISVAYYALDCLYMQTMCRIIGKADRAEHYAKEYAKVKAHFRATYCNEEGELLPAYRTQCGYLLAIRMGLLDGEKLDEAVASLKKKIVDNGYKLSTGFVGSCILCEVLAEHGENNLAYSLLLQTENPSWLYSVLQGATTIWERWNSYTIATGFGDVSMNSFNHYAYGSVQEWMYRHIAGIETTEQAPGFEKLVLQPKPDTRTPEEIPEGQERITWAKTSFNSRTGLIVSNWSTEEGFRYECTTPVDTTLYLPILTDKDVYRVNGVEHKMSDTEKTPCGKAMVITLAPGTYVFEQ